MNIIEQALAKASAERQRHQTKEEKLPAPGPSGITSVDLETKKLDARLVAYRDQKSAIAEQYRSLRTKILQIKATRALNSLLIASATPAEGKSLTAVNLALTIAQGEEQTVLLIDADLRNGGVSGLLGIRTKRGLSEYLQGTEDLESCLVRLTKIDRLTILPAGSRPSNPAELLGSNKMAMLLRQVKHRDKNGIVLIDAPPVIPLTDASILAPSVDGVIFIIRAGRVRKDTVTRALSQFGNVEVLGVVINDVDSLGAGDYGDYYHYYAR
jgi:exopolysaccharide/PEP-CTERM locus tyrosine autokinase